MDRKEAILRIKEHMKHHGIGKYPHLKLKEALDMAIAALSRPNEPLTLEQLREMDGEPAYVSVSGMEILTMWALIEYIPESRSIVLTNNLGGRPEYFDDDDIKSDGITIYRRPLTKMEANENG